MSEFESYDYLRVTVQEEQLSEYLDGYENFGWKLDPNIPVEKNGGKAVLHFKRSRAILNKTELIRLQRHYEACMREREKLEESKASAATMAAISCGAIGCAFIAGSVFAVTAQTPIIWLMVLLAIPGFVLWGAAYPVYTRVRAKKEEEINPLIEAKTDEAEAVCGKAHALL